MAGLFIPSVGISIFPGQAANPFIFAQTASPTLNVYSFLDMAIGIEFGIGFQKRRN